MSDTGDHERSWRAQRLAWGGLAVIVVCACLGVFGDGPVAHASTSLGQDGKIEFSRIVRRSRTEVVRVAYQPLEGAHPVRVRVSDSWFEIEDVVPEPRLSERTPEELRLHFATVGDGTQFVEFMYTPVKAGRHVLAVGHGADRQDVTVLVLP